MAGLRRIPFRTRLRVPVGDVVERTGWLVEGPAGWGECSPLPSWSPSERDAAERSAIEAASLEFPAQLRARVEVNALVPRVTPAHAAVLAISSACETIKVKVGDADSEARVRAVREALPDARIRLDANGAWSVEQAMSWLSQLRGYGIELVEDPVATLDELATLRRSSPIPVAAEASVRTIEDARRLRMLDAADAVVLKPQRIGGVRAALEAADEAGVPAIASSALETSVGIAAVLATAAALPDAPFAHGVGTASLLERDVVADPLAPVDGWLDVRRPVVVAELVAP